MSQQSGDTTIGITAGSAFDLSIERDVFEGLDVTLRPVDIETTDDLIAKCNGVDAIIDRLLAAPYTAEVVDTLDRCRIIARCGIGVDAFATQRAAEQGMFVVNIPEYCQNEVSEHTIMLLLALERNLTEYDTAMKNGVWAQDVIAPTVNRLRGQRLGLVGFGKIARLVAEKAQAFRMDVVASDPYIEEEQMAQAGVEKKELEEVLDVSDVVSLHAPLVEETEWMIDADALDRMKNSAYLINVARGGLVVEDELVTALREDNIAGAGLDVFNEEPSSQGDSFPPFESELQALDNVVLTPHVAWFSKEANDERRRKAAHEVRRVLQGKHPESPVNEPQIPDEGDIQY